MTLSRICTLIVASFLLLMTCACNFHFGEGEIIENYQTFSIPFIEGDREGILTQELVNEVSTQTSLVYRNCGGDLTLIVKIREVAEQDIGFRYDQNKKGKLIHYIIPSESRLTLFADISLLEASSGNELMGPILIEASYEFDHDYNTSRNSVNIFSLGQLTNFDEAYDAALLPLYRNLSIKIVDYIKAAW